VSFIEFLPRRRCQQRTPPANSPAAVVAGAHTLRAVRCSRPTTKPPEETMKTTHLVLAAFAAISGLALAADDAGRTYRFGMHDKHTNITFSSETEVETINGISHTAKGSTWIDFEALKGKCDIAVPVSSLRTGIDARDEHLRSDQWLDAEKHPDIKLASESFDLTVKNKDKGIYESKLKGKLTIHGVTKDLETTAKVVKLSAEQNKLVGEGEWVHVIATFDVTLKDFDVIIPSERVLAKVSPTWTVKFDCYASTAEPK
jgi:polyisoprenoid-binding protein YceI